MRGRGATGPVLALFGLASAAVAAGGWNAAHVVLATVAVVTGVSLSLAGLAPGAGSGSRLDPTPPTPDAMIDQEMERSRRHERPFTLARLRRAEGDPEAAADLLRRNDRLWVLGEDVLVLLPETDRRGAVVALDRLHRALRAHRLSAAAFPEDALTVPGLVRTLNAPVDDGSEAASDEARPLPPPSGVDHRAAPTQEAR